MTFLCRTAPGFISLRGEFSGKPISVSTDAGVSSAAKHVVVCSGTLGVVLALDSRVGAGSSKDGSLRWYQSHDEDDGEDNGCLHFVSVFRKYKMKVIEIFKIYVFKRQVLYLEDWLTCLVKADFEVLTISLKLRPFILHLLHYHSETIQHEPEIAVFKLQLSLNLKQIAIVVNFAETVNSVSSIISEMFQSYIC